MKFIILIYQGDLNFFWLKLNPSEVPSDEATRINDEDSGAVLKLFVRHPDAKIELSIERGD